MLWPTKWETGWSTALVASHLIEFELNPLQLLEARGKKGGLTAQAVKLSFKNLYLSLLLLQCQINKTKPVTRVH